MKKIEVKEVKIYRDLGCGSFDGDISIRVFENGDIAIEDDNGAGEPNVIFIDSSSTGIFTKLVNDAVKFAKRLPNNS